MFPTCSPYYAGPSQTQTLGAVKTTAPAERATTQMGSPAGEVRRGGQRWNCRRSRHGLITGALLSGGVGGWTVDLPDGSGPFWSWAEIGASGRADVGPGFAIAR